MGRVYAVASGKGGVGKTTTTAALGATLAASSASAVVVDADLGMANLAPALGVDDGAPTLHDVLADTATVEEATRETTDGLAVVPGSRDLDAFADARPEGLADALAALAETYDYVLVDTGAGLSADTIAPLRAADEVLLVSTPDRDALRNTEKTAEVCRRLGTPVRGLVILRADDDALPDDMSAHDVLVTVPDDPAVAAALDAATPLPSHAPESPAAAAYRSLARVLTDLDVPDPAPAAAAEDADPDAGGEAAEPSADAEADERSTEDGTETEAGEASATPPDEAAGAPVTIANDESAGDEADDGPAETSNGVEVSDETAETGTGQTGEAADADAEQGTREAERDEVETDEAERDEVETDEAERDEGETDEAERDERETDEGETDEAERDERETDERDTDETQTDEDDGRTGLLSWLFR